MTATRTVTLEILRPGPPHNQLLSPLTPYIAVCSNRSPETLHVDVEHHELLRWMLDLSYERETGDGVDQARKAVTRLLGSIRGLAAELAGAAPGEHIHLRLVLTAQELASLPFEMADAPPGFPAEGQALFRQATKPIAITRESRRIPKVPFTWPDRPKILFAWASPPGVPEVPSAAHALCLRQALAPWLGWKLGEGEAPEREELAGHLTILAMATWEDITRACAAERFTHVHILAHGAPTPSVVLGGERFGLLLHDPSPAGKRVVDADDLDVALRGGSCSTSKGAPTVVTLAACNLGKIGGVMLPGSGLAHALHEKGVPLVVGSQFPLTFRGSVVMARVLYQGLLHGEDPRCTLQHARRELYARCPGKHDWASLVAYASLPENLEAQLPSVHFTRTRKKTDVAVHRATVALRSERYPVDDKQPKLDAQGELKKLDETFESLRQIGTRVEADTTLSAFAPDEAWVNEQIRVERRARVESLLASVALRWGDALLEKPRTLSTKPPDLNDGTLRLTEMNETEVWRLARQCYQRVFQSKRIHWALVQELALTWVLGKPLNLRDWSTAWELARGASDDVSYWSRAELLLLSLSFDSLPGEIKVEEAPAMARSELEALVDNLGIRSFRAFSARRQLGRYTHWAGREEAGPHRDEIARVAADLGALLKRLGVPERWPES